MTTQRILLRLAIVASMLLVATSAALAADPGIPIPFGSPEPLVSDQTRGSILIYNIYTSSPSNPGAQNTRFSITNTNDLFGTAVHLFFVDGATCSIADRYVCLTPNQTMTFLASEQDPGTTGYLVTISTFEDGVPRPFDYLVGDEYVKFESGFFGSLGAEAIPSHNVNRVELSPDGSLFAMSVLGLPRVLAVDNIGSREDGNQTLLVVNGVGGVFSVVPNTIGTLFGILYDDAEQAHSWSRRALCQLVLPLSNDFPKTTPRFDVVIPAGQSGWMKFWSTTTIPPAPDGRALLGVVFQRNTSVSSSAGAFQGARNLHKLRLVSVNRELNGVGVAGVAQTRFASGVSQVGDEPTFFVFPIFPANCGFVGESTGGG